MLNLEQKKSLTILWLAQFIGMGAITGVISFLPLYVTHLGITSAEEAALWSGIIIGSASFCAALSNPYWGAMADSKGRKPMVEKVLFMFGIIIIAMAFASNVYQLLVLRITQGLCGGFVAAATALAVSMSPPEDISFIIGIFQTALIVGGAFGPMLGGFIADQFGYQQPFLVFGVLCLISLLVIHFNVKETFVPTPKNKLPSLKETFRYIWSLKDVRLLLFIQFLAQFAIQCIGPILPLFIQTIASDATNIASISGSVIAIAGITSGIASASMGKLTKIFSHRQILICSSFAGGLTFLGQLYATDIFILSILRALNGLCIGAMIPSSNTIITYLIPESKRGAAYGVTSGAALMGNVLGPISAGLLSISLGIPSIFMLTFLLFLVASFLLYLYIKKEYCSQNKASF